MPTTTWDALTSRLQAYLKAVFDLDQAAEQAKAESFRYDRIVDSRPASVWRWITFATLETALGRLPKRENAEVLLAELVTLGLLEREAPEENSTARTRLKITPAGRKVVRQGLGIAPKRKGDLSEQQTRYAQAIVNAGLAAWGEVEAAFHGGSQGKAKVDAWGQALRDRASQTHQDYLESLTRWEPCAYPGCTNKIKVVTYQHGIGQRESPEPVRKMRVWYQTAGWHRELGSKDLVPNSETMSKSLYACSPGRGPDVDPG
jgi:hypothetical protein